MMYFFPDNHLCYVPQFHRTNDNTGQPVTLQQNPSIMVCVFYSQEAGGTQLKLEARQLSASLTCQMYQKEPFTTTARLDGREQ